METLFLVKHIEDLFKKNKNFSDKHDKLFVPKILESIDKIDNELIKLLIKDEKAKKHFFTKIEDVYILKQNDLIEFFTMNEYFNHSHTSYTNKIGMIKKDNFIKKFDDVVLAWPYKDCVLEGGQSKDDDKKNEVFYNQIISKDEINRLFEPKVLTNIKKYTKDKVINNSEITEDDNLIIKGNNLLALHSLKKIYAKKVKLIYIDPPYNTSNDSFKYNDRFNHSTWLTFMNNRLEVAREFLRDDGVIFVQCDDNEQAYLKVLMDEIFGVNCFVSDIAVRSSTPSGLKTAHKEKTIIKQRDSILVYKKHTVKLKPQYTQKEKWDTHYSFYFDIKNKKVLKLVDVLKKENLLSEKENLNNFDTKQKNHTKFYLKHRNNIFRTAPEMPRDIKQLSKEKEGEVIEYKGQDGSNQYALNGNRFSFLEKSIKTIYRNQIFEEDLAILLCDFWADIDFQNTQNEGGVSFTNGKKPESLLHRIIDMTTSESDIIMDYHLGSGTTCAVAHKMNRRYIGIEQMDYIEDIAVERLKKVINAEQGGISKALKWKGGGSFIYAQLKEINNFKNSEINKLNKNMQYLPISEIDDEDYNISEEEKSINKKFYGCEDE